MMNTNRSKLVSIERAIKLIDSYGADTQSWPEDERVAAISLVQASDELQNRIQEARQLDDALNAHSLPAQNELSALAIRIIDQLPEQTSIEHSSESAEAVAVYHEPTRRWLKSTIAAGLMCLSIGYFVMQSQPTTDSPTTLTLSNLDQWMLDEVIRDSENEESDDLTFMTMVELEN